MKLDLSIIIPLYNEEKNIWPIFEEIKELDIDNFFIEIILVDNGSTDKTEEKIEEIIDDHNKNNQKNILIRKLSIAKNINYDGGIYKGLENAKGKFLSWTHGDLQTPIEDVIKLFKIISKKHKIFAKGIRVNNRGFDFIISKFHERLASFVLQKKMREINAQPKIFNKEDFYMFKNPPKNYTCLDTYFYYNSLINNLEIVEMDVIFKSRINGSSKWKNNFYTFIKHLIFNTLYLFKLRIFK